jgi:hypothetical protein
MERRGWKMLEKVGGERIRDKIVE